MAGPRIVRRLQVGSLWTGTGQTSLALAGKPGVDLLFMCESDPDRRRVLIGTFPRIPVLKDATLLDRHPHLVAATEMLFGEFPCTECSQMGELGGPRAGLRGPNSGTVIRMFESLGRLSRGGANVPHVVVLENVPGLLSLDGACGMSLLRDAAAAAGYLGGEWRTVDAGVWAGGLLRERVIIVMWQFSANYRGMLLSGDYVYTPPRVEGLLSLYLRDSCGGACVGRLRTLKTSGDVCYSLAGGPLTILSAEQACLVMGMDYGRLSSYLSERAVLGAAGDGVRAQTMAWVVDRCCALSAGYPSPPEHTCASAVWSNHCAGWWDVHGFKYVDMGLAPVPPCVDVMPLCRALRGGEPVPLPAVSDYLHRRLGRASPGLVAAEVPVLRSSLWRDEQGACSVLATPCAFACRLALGERVIVLTVTVWWFFPSFLMSTSAGGSSTGGWLSVPSCCLGGGLGFTTALVSLVTLPTVGSVWLARCSPPPMLSLQCPCCLLVGLLVWLSLVWVFVLLPAPLLAPPPLPVCLVGVLLCLPCPLLLLCCLSPQSSLRLSPLLVLVSGSCPFRLSRRVWSVGGTGSLAVGCAPTWCLPWPWCGRTYAFFVSAVYMLIVGLAAWSGAAGACVTLCWRGSCVGFGSLGVRRTVCSRMVCACELRFVSRWVVLLVSLARGWVCVLRSCLLLLTSI